MAKRKSIQYTSSSSPSPSPSERITQFSVRNQRLTKPTPLIGLVAMIPGLFLLSIGLGIIHPSGTVHGPLFLVSACGSAFFLAGVSIIFQGLGLNPRSWVNNVLGLLILGSMLTPFVWVAFLNNSIPPFARIMFGLIVCFILFIAAVVAFARFIPGVRVISRQDGESFTSISPPDDKL
jgi:hypothetical protein